jgi:hypothetical protein
VSDRIWQLAPADLGTLWSDCRRCFYLAITAGFPRPVSEAPSARIRQHLVGALGGRRGDAIAPGMPAGVIEPGPRSIRSAPLSVQLPDHSYRCVIRGSLELLMTRDDGTLGVLEVDAVLPDAAQTRRLHAWAHALESAGAGKVSILGALVFEPAGSWRWSEVERDDAEFYGVLAEALSLLEAPTPPGGTPLCAFCVYRDASRRTGY